MSPLDAESFHGPFDRPIDHSMRPHNTDLSDWSRHTRSPSPTESFSDSPSVYSHAYTSPHPPQSYYDGRPSPQDFASRPSTYCDSFGPAASSLGFPDDSAPPPDSMHSALTDTDEASTVDEDVSDHRMSLNGPKIRFHSKAPWETGEDSIVEDEDGTDQSTTSGMFGKFNKGKSDKTDAIKRTFGRGIAVVNRTSHESSRSHPDKRSLEAGHSNQSPHRSIFNMPQGGMSSGSLALPPSASSYQSQFPHRTRHYAPVSTDPNRRRTQESSRPATSPGLGHGAPIHMNLTTGDDTLPSPLSDRNRSPAARSATPSSQYSSQDDATQEAFVHPYAHPDLVSRHPDYPTYETSSAGPVGSMFRSDSIATVTDTTSSSRSAVFSAATADTSSSSLLPSSSNLRVQARNISGPISVVHTNDPSVVKGSQTRSTKLSIYPTPAKGFSDWSQPMSPTVTLISLEEAQARERARSANPTNTIVHSRSHLSEEDDGAGTSYGIASSHSSDDARTRARSTSAGARNKPRLSPASPPMPVSMERRESEPAVAIAQAGDARGLKHKKSGFMRLFNGREKDKGIPPPPVPYPTNLRPEQESQRGNIPKSTRLVLPRVPVPPLSPTLPSDLSRSDDLDDHELSERRNNSPSRKHSTPSLYINTASAAVGLDSVSRSQTSSIQPSSSMLAVPSSQSAPQSAPPGTVDFPSLRLRPVSASFSSHFASIVSSPEATEQEFDLDTPSTAQSSGTTMSLVTPSGGDDQFTTSAIGEKSVVKALQEQIVSAKRAWQQQKMELESHVRELQAEVDALRSLDQGYCEHCGRGSDNSGLQPEEYSKKAGVVNRPRAITGDCNTARFAGRQ